MTAVAYMVALLVAAALLVRPVLRCAAEARAERDLALRRPAELDAPHWRGPVRAGLYDAVADGLADPHPDDF